MRKRRSWKHALIALGTLAVVGGFAVWQVKRWTCRSTHEAVTYVGAIARGAVAAYLREQPDGSHQLCPSTRDPVPSDRPRNKYQPRDDEWEAAGFFCLRFDSKSTQYCQYGYEADSAGFVAWGRCDPDEDGIVSEYRLRGRVVGADVNVDDLEVTNEGE